MKLKLWQKDVLSALIVAVGGFILFNLAFMAAALLSTAMRFLLHRPENAAPEAAARVVFLALMAALSWLVYRSKWNDTVKAAFMTMPLMSVLVMTGIAMFQQPVWAVLAAGAVLPALLVLYFIRKKMSWIYYFAVSYVVALALLVQFAGIEI